MKGYKLEIYDAMSFTKEERFFTSLSKAKKEFSKKVYKINDLLR